MISFDDIRRSVAQELDMDERDITPATTFVSLPMDSMEKAALVIELEEVLDCDLPDDDLPKLVTLGDVLEYANTRSHRS